MRKIENIKLKTNAEIKTDEISTNLRKWLEDNSNSLKPDANANGVEPDEKANDKATDETVYLLSFHDDGVVWGKLKAENGVSKLLTSDVLKDSAGKSFPSPSPEFRVETLQECRLFSIKGELYVWRNGNGFKARLIEDNSMNSKAEDREYFDEKQVLWGTQIEIIKDNNGSLLTNGNFTVIADGSEGLRHAFPQKVDAKKFDGKKRPLRLCVRHYLTYDNDGCAYVSLSRLVDVEVE
jgi:CRISPR-associated protein (TIGR03984 family)